MADVQWTTGDKYIACPLRLDSHGGHVPCVPVVPTLVGIDVQIYHKL